MDMITSKWRDLNRKMSNFNVCFIQLNRNPQSGASEATIITNALYDYCKIYKHKSFPNLASWEIARRHSKWEPVDLVDLDGPTTPRRGGLQKDLKLPRMGTTQLLPKGCQAT